MVRCGWQSAVRAAYRPFGNLQAVRVECRLGVRSRGRERGMEVVIAVDDPRVDDVRALLEAHLAFSRAVTPPGHVHALEIDGLLQPAVTLFSAGRDGGLAGIGQLNRHDNWHA